MAKFIGSRPHTAITYLPHLLLFASFGVLLGGLAAMQNECGAGVNNEIVGSTTYLAPVSCDLLYSLDWFIVFFTGFVWLLLLPAILGRQIHKSRNMMTGLLIITSLLLMFMTNTWYHAWSGLGNSAIRTNTYNKRAKVTFAGALSGAVSSLMLLMLIGLHDEKATPEGEMRTTGERAEAESAPYRYRTGPAPEPIETETVGYRPGPVGATEAPV